MVEEWWGICNMRVYVYITGVISMETPVVQMVGASKTAQYAAILDCGDNNGYNRKVMFPITDVLNSTNESNCSSQT